MPKASKLAVNFRKFYKSLTHLSIWYKTSITDYFQRIYRYYNEQFTIDIILNALFVSLMTLIMFDWHKMMS